MYTDLILLLEEFLNAAFPEVADGWTKVEKLAKERIPRKPLLFYFLLGSTPVDGASSILFCSKYLVKSYHC